MPSCAKFLSLTIASLLLISPAGLVLMSALPAMPQTASDRKATADRLKQQALQQYRQGQLQEALTTFQQELELRRAIGDRQGEGLTLNSLGAVHTGLGQYSQALALYQQSLVIRREVGDRIGAGATLNNLGWIYSSLGQYPQALEMYQQALPIMRAVGNRAGESATLTNLGLVYDKLAQYPRALEFFQQALNIQQELADRSAEDTLLNNIGEVYRKRGQAAQALEYFQQSLRLSQATGDRASEGITLNNIGLTYTNLGLYPAALNYLQQALTIRREVGDRAGEGTILSNIGGAYIALGQYAQALEINRQALTLQQAVGDRAGAATTLTHLGLAAANLGQYPQAGTFFQQSLVLRRELGDRAGEGTTLSNLGTMHDRLAQYPQALESYQQALRIVRDIGNQADEGTLLNNIGLVYHNLGQSQKSLAFFQQALRLNRVVGNRSGEGTVLNNMGIAELALGQSALAEQRLREAITIWEALRPGLSDANKIALFETQAMTYRALQQSLIAQHKPDQALEIAERGQARAFVELLAQRLQTNTLVRPAVSAQALTLAQIQQLAQKQQATLVRYSVNGDRALYIWVIQPGGTVTFRQVNLEPLLRDQQRTLAQYIQQSRGEALGLRGIGITARADAPQTQQKLRELHQLLIAPIADLLPTDPNQPIVFIPQGALFLVPFAALQAANGQYLIQNHTLLTAPSIQVLTLTQRQRQKSGLRPKSPALVVGNPVMPKVVLEPGKPAAPLPALLGAEQEARTIATLLNVPLLSGTTATETAVKRQMSNAELIHLATHGLLDDQRGMGSAIALTPSDQDDGLLTAEEILHLSLQADLVVLSACDTGRGRITGDGVIGLSRSLISAGVPSIIVSLWAVPDAPTAALMTEFYKNWQQRHLNKAQTLRQAMLTTMKTHPHPRDWAAFTLIGEAK